MDRLVEQTEERRRLAERHDRKGGKRRGGGENRRDVEQQRVGRLRPQLFLEDQLDDVGERLQQAARADQIRPVALLDERGDLALHVDQHGGRNLQRQEDDANQADDAR